MVTTVFLLLCIVNIFRYIKVPAVAAVNGYPDDVRGVEQQIDERYAYAGDTCYTGNPYLSDELFKAPFQRTGSYISNNELIAQIGEENVGIFVKKSKDAIAAVFDLSYQERDINDPVLKDILADGLHVLFVSGIFSESKEDTIEKVNAWFVDNQISMEAQLYTDKCMVFFDESRVIVRGQMAFRVYGSGNTDILKNHLGLDAIEPGEKYTVILELEFISKSNAYDYDTYQLCKINCI